MLRDGGWSLATFTGPSTPFRGPHADEVTVVPSLAEGGGPLDHLDLRRAVSNVTKGSSGLGVVIIDSGLPDVEGTLTCLLGAVIVQIIGISVPVGELAKLDRLRTLMMSNRFRPALYDGYTLWAFSEADLRRDEWRIEVSTALLEARVTEGDVSKIALLQKRLRIVGRQLDSSRGEAKDLRQAIAAHGGQQPARLAGVEQELRVRVRELETSRSWKLTRPLRGIRELLNSAARALARVNAPAGRAMKVIQPSSLAGRASIHYVSRDDDEAALEARLEVVRETLGLKLHFSTAEGIGQSLADSAPADRRAWWLIHIGYVGSLPSDAYLDELVELAKSARTALAIARLRALRSRHAGEWQVTAPLEVISTPVFDASFAATTPLHTGVQRVVRNVAPHWVASGVVPVVLDQETSTWRAPNRGERNRLLHWNDAYLGSPPTGHGPDDRRQCHVIVPWNTTVIIPELKPPNDNVVLRCAASASGNTFVGIVYDLMPITVSEYVPGEVTAGFGGYLAMVKHFARASAISSAAGAEFQGFGLALGSQGLRGPEIQAHLLPIVAPPEADPQGPAKLRSLRNNSQLPLLLQVGSISRHKNQGGTLDAAALLWDEGLLFELIFVAPNSWAGDDFAVRVARQQSMGRPVTVLTEVAESVLWQLYRDARAVALPSFVEGYGLPIAEALSVGTPVITSAFGSMAEIAQDGGALLVRPEDAGSIASAMRTMLGDSIEFANLKAAAGARERTSWQSYSAQVLAWLLDSEKGSE